MASLTVESSPMAHRPVYWSETVHPSSICMGCGEKINYDEEMALVAVQEPLSSRPSEEDLEGVQRFLLCPECGTNVDKLVELGIKRIIDLEIEDPNSPDDEDLELLPQPFADEKKN